MEIKKQKSRSAIKVVANNLKGAKRSLGKALSKPEVLARVGKRGYDAKKIQAGVALHGAAKAALDRRKSVEGDQLVASKAFQACKQSGCAGYQELAKSCRALWSGQPELLAKLGLNKPMPRNDKEFLTAAEMLYNTENYSPEMLDELDDYGFDAKKFAAGLAVIEAMDDADAEHDQAKGDTTKAVADQKSTLGALQKWVTKFNKFARIELKDRPDLLKTRDLPARLTRTPAQRLAPQKAAATRRAKKIASLNKAASAAA